MREIPPSTKGSNDADNNAEQVVQSAHSTMVMLERNGVD